MADNLAINHNRIRMNKNKQSTDYLPKNIQITLISVLAAAFAINTIYSILLLVRVYADGLRPSQFTFMTFSFLLLPVVLFTTGYLVANKGLSRLSRLAYAAALTITGYFLHSLVSVADRVLALHTTLYQNAPFLNGGMIALPIVVTLFLYVGLLLILHRQNTSADKMKLLQYVIIPLAFLAFAVNSIFSIGELIMRHIGSKNMMNLLVHPDLIISTVLPLIYFVIAYIITRGVSGLSRLYTAIIYTTAGALATMIILTVSNYSLRTLYVVLTSLTIYVLLILLNNWTRVFGKKRK
jgi:hypothetical protein